MENYSVMELSFVKEISVAIDAYYRVYAEFVTYFSWW